MEQAAAPHQLAAQLVGVGQIAVVADREPAELEIGEERLDVARRHLAGRRIAHMADRHRPRQPGDDVLRAEIVADQAGAAMGAELLAVIGDDTGRFLAAMLQRMQPERGQRRRVGMTIHPEHATFVVEAVDVRVADRPHPPSSIWPLRAC